MTEQELIERAIESAKCRIYRLKANKGESFTHQMKVEKQVEIQKVTIKALEKQIAKKVRRINIPNTEWSKAETRYECPSCHKINAYCRTDYCVLCGQKLDWGNEDAE